MEQWTCSSTVVTTETVVLALKRVVYIKGLYMALRGRRCAWGRRSRAKDQLCSSLYQVLGEDMVKTSETDLDIPVDTTKDINGNLVISTVGQVSQLGESACLSVVEVVRHSELNVARK